MSKKINNNSPDCPLYQKWNKTTATCFINHMRCDICENEDACNIAPQFFNDFNLKNVKFATLMTYRNIGKKGMERYLDESDE